MSHFVFVLDPLEIAALTIIAVVALGLGVLVLFCKAWDAITGLWRKK